MAPPERRALVFTDDGAMSRRAYLVMRVLMNNADLDLFSAIEAVSSCAVDHPEWDMDERKTWDEWEEGAIRALVHESIPWEEE